jgi:hypothetical protein
MSINAPFSPGQTLTFAVTDANSNASFAAGGAQASVIEVQNLGLSTCFIAFGATATTAGYPIGPGQSKVVSKAPGVAQIAAICASGQNTTLYVTAGQGR